MDVVAQERMQRSFTKMLPFSYEERLEWRMLRGDVIEIYTNHEGIDGIDCKIRFPNKRLI